MSIARKRMCGVLAALSCVLALPAAAVEPLDTFSVKLGGYASRFDTRVRVDGQAIEGTEFELHRDLGIDQDNTIGLLGVSWRPFEHHEFGLAYYRDDVSARRTLERDIVFEDVTYEANARVSAEYDLDVYELYYVWWLALHERWALGPRVGAVWYRYDLGIDLEADANGNPVGTGFDRRARADVPAPAIGGGWRWTPGENWRISADIGYFSTSIGSVDADVLYGRAGVEWFPWERLGFWFDFTVNDIDADLDKNDFRGNLDFRQEGLRLGGIYRF